jgi:hypothetical protein
MASKTESPISSAKPALSQVERAFIVGYMIDMRRKLTQIADVRLYDLVYETLKELAIFVDTVHDDKPVLEGCIRHKHYREPSATADDRHV